MPAVTAHDHLRALTSIEPVYCETDDPHYRCAFCSNRFASHAPDCPWVAAKGWVEDQDEAERQLAERMVRYAELTHDNVFPTPKEGHNC